MKTVDAIGERAAAQQLHDHVRASVSEPADVIDLADVRMADGAGGARLALETLDRITTPLLSAVQDLDGDASAQGDLLCFIDGAHAALPDDTQDAVAPVEDHARHAEARHGGGIDRGVERVKVSAGNSRRTGRLRRGNRSDEGLQRLARGGADSLVAQVERATMGTANEACDLLSLGHWRE